MKNIKIFTSGREQKLWILVFMVLVTIFSTLAIGSPLQEMLRNQNVQAIFFALGMILTGTTIIIHGLKVRPSKTEIAIWSGLAAIYIMFFFRLGAPERSHLMEYSVLAIFIHNALSERLKNGNKLPQIELFAILITAFFGILDESIQSFIPDRVFDFEDIFFNIFAGLLAVSASWILGWAKRKGIKTYKRKSSKKEKTN